MYFQDFRTKSLYPELKKHRFCLVAVRCRKLFAVSFAVRNNYINGQGKEDTQRLIYVYIQIA